MTALEPRKLLSCLVIALLTGVALPALAADRTDLDIDARLVWGSNEEKSPDPGHKPVGSELAKKFKMLKWKHYFLVNRQHTNVTFAATASVKMSDHCTIQIKNLGDHRIEVKLLGDGKLVGTWTQPLAPGEDLILGGDAKDDTAWLVVLGTPAKPSDPKNPAPKAETPKDAKSKEGATNASKP